MSTSIRNFGAGIDSWPLIQACICAMGVLSRTTNDSGPILASACWRIARLVFSLIVSDALRIRALQIFRPRQAFIYSGEGVEQSLEMSLRHCRLASRPSLYELDSAPKAHGHRFRPKRVQRFPKYRLSQGVFLVVHVQTVAEPRIQRAAPASQAH